MQDNIFRNWGNLNHLLHMCSVVSLILEGFLCHKKDVTVLSRSLKSFTVTLKGILWKKYMNLGKIFVFIVFILKDTGKSIHLLRSSLV